MKASILLPVYNAEKTIGETLQSIINQKYKDYEIIIINDGSTDLSERIIYTFQDTRIKYYKNETNKGLIYTLNKGINLCKGQYIIRIDADDIMLPQRIAIQIAFMDKNPEIIASGSSIIKFATKSKSTHVYVPPLTPDEIKSKILLGSPIPHPSSIIRKEAFTRYNIQYDYNYLHAEDYKLWYDLSQHGLLANIKEPLIKYRCSETQISHQYNTKQIEIAKKIKKLILSDILEKHKIALKSSIDLQYILDLSSKLPNNATTSTILFLLILSQNLFTLTGLWRLINSGIFMRKGFSYKYIIAIFIKYINKKSLNRFDLSQIE